MEPVRRFEMPNNINGWYSPPTLRFSEGEGSGDALMAAQTVHGHGVVGWLAWHAPTLGLAAVLLGLLIGALVVVRMARRPQRLGQFYCRKCNYDLTGPGGMPPEDGPEARCPECGIELARRPARLGRTAAARAWPAMTCCILGVMLGAGVMWATLKWGGTPWETAWMSRATTAMGLRPLYRREGVLSEVGEAMVVRRWELSGTEETGGAVRNVWPGVFGFNGDGTHAVFAQLGGGSNPGEVRVLRLADDDEFGIMLGAPTFQQGLPCPSRDPVRVYVPCTASPAVVGAKSYEQQVWEVDLRARTSKLLGSISVDHSQVPTNAGITAMPTMREVDGRLVWCVLVVRPGAAGGPPAAEVMLPGGRVFPVPIAGNAGQPVLSADGKRLVCVDHTAAARTEVEVSLVDGAVVTRNVSWSWMSDESNTGLRAVVGAGPVVPGIDILNRAGAVVARLAVPAGMVPGGPVAMSADSRWCAASCTRTVTDWLGNPGMESEVVLWDLSSHLPSVGGR